MKRVLLTLAVVLLASPAFAQEIDSAWRRASSLLNIPPRGNALQPGRGPRGRGAPAPARRACSSGGPSCAFAKSSRPQMPVVPANRKQV
jgi:hypothetical protein